MEEINSSVLLKGDAWNERKIRRQFIKVIMAGMMIMISLTGCGNKKNVILGEEVEIIDFKAGTGDLDAEEVGNALAVSDEAIIKGSIYKTAV